MKLLRITTVPIFLQKLLQGQPQYMMQKGIEVLLASADGKEIPEIEKTTGLKVHVLPFTHRVSIAQNKYEYLKGKYRKEFLCV